RRALARLDAVFLGALHGTELADAYAAFDIFAHTGTEETFGQTIQEAQASGLPVIAPRAGGPIDLIAHGETGLLTEPAHPDSIRDAVLTLITDPAARARLGEAGRRAVLGRTWESLGDQLIGHYGRVVDAARARVEERFVPAGV
ncbi:MAG: glycosyltransferase, partial [Microcella sp.]